MPTSSKAHEMKAPSDLMKALGKNPKVMEAWKNTTQIARRDFITWIEGAKQEATRARRIEVAYSKLEKGDKRPCCYAVLPMNFYKALGASPKAKAGWSTLSANEKRDFVAWVEEPETKEEKAKRIEKACFMLIDGKKKP